MMKGKKGSLRISQAGEKGSDGGKRKVRPLVKGLSGTLVKN